ncbi:levanase [Pseudoclavibacter sp. JAI123]|uniref:glycoside hydrolase family 32 protein n=1 Tax=Pseudoclavibacter sp. JAI123 TaxID=2723065 RepID=UPI0015C9B9BB|nr:GH32 C-terminal domain-containing protein [Pseudoclavibacter sp. JAI123]NYF12698.1 levanase [Pseudoclavibacter sp. JAI123]
MTSTSPRHPRRTRKALAALAATSIAFAVLTGTAATATAEESAEAGQEQFRPQFHFSPEKNWMNDPNGMVYVDGVYHLYYQHNPEGTRWGNMSWGHATSTDLMHWEEQPLALPQTFDDSGVAIEDIFSGSIVVDETNSSGFGTGDKPPLVAIYTSAYTQDHPTHPGIQAQSLAYSNDGGYTWTKHEGNPVYDRGSADFRDPKVFWYDGPAGAYWVMAAVEAVDHKVILAKSTDLRSWEHLSEFGPANSTEGIWECPELFELPVDGNPDETKWVMVVNLNPGAVAGGSGGQYFVGDFDGTEFTSETTVEPGTTAEGTPFATFDGGDFSGWTVTNESGNEADGPWGLAPAAGTLPGQGPVKGAIGAGFANGFHGGDWPVGSLESPQFTIESDVINLLVGGGNHPHVDGSQLGNEPPAGTTVFDFELADGENLLGSGWEATGDFALDPARSPSTTSGEYALGDKRVNTWEGGPLGDDNTGTITSPSFTLDGDFASFLVGGGNRTDGTLQVELLVDGSVVRTQTGANAGQMTWQSWDISEFADKDAQLRVRDEATGGWGHLTFDHLVIGDEPSQLRSEETAVNLIVDGEVVRTATGRNSETLDWASWDVSDLRGQQATIQAVDQNRSGWGHLMLDQIMFADTSVPSTLESYDWLDWGRDYYATVSYFGTPEGSRIMQGWMNNWDYANDIPTSTWRSSMTLPREVVLTSTPAGPRLKQQVVPQVDEQLDVAGAATRTDVTLDGAVDLGLSGDVVKLEVTLEPGEAQRAGITVFGDAESGTRIGYDAAQGRLFVDRTNSGDVDFHPAFASVEDAPVALDDDGSVSFSLYLDRASVELFTADGMVTITDQVFPNEGADAITAWSEGGAATLRRITVTPVTPTMWQEPGPVVTPPTATATATPTGGASPSPSATSASTSAPTSTSVPTSTPQGGSDTGTPTPEGLASTGADFPLAAVLFGLAFVGGGAVLGARRLGRRGQ